MAVTRAIAYIRCGAGGGGGCGDAAVGAVDVGAEGWSSGFLFFKPQNLCFFAWPVFFSPCPLVFLAPMVPLCFFVSPGAVGGADVNVHLIVVVVLRLHYVCTTFVLRLYYACTTFVLRLYIPTF